MQVAKWGVNRMPLLGRAWKANINVWKRHLTLQSVFSRGECMMHVDKNADDHVVDQNLDRISREIAYVPLCGGSGPNVVHTIFFFFEWVRDMLTWRTTDPGSCFQRPRILGLWLIFSEDQRFQILAHVFRGLGFWGLSHVFRGPRIFWALAHVFRRPKVLDPGSCFQRPRILGSWLMFSEDQEFFGLWLMFSEDQRF